MGKPRGINTARKQKTRRRTQKWADKDWKKALAAIKPCARRIELGKEPPLDELLADLGRLTGRFPRELAADITTARESGDDERVAELILRAHLRPSDWLVRTYLNW